MAVGAAVTVVVAAGLGIWIATSSSSATPLITTTTTVQTVSTGTITKTASSSGTIEPANQAPLNFGASGRVTAVDVSVGQTVTAGQTLAAIDSSSLSASLAQAQAILANDEALLSTDQSSSATSSQIASDEAAIASAQTQVASAQTSLSDATLTSTIAGTVATVNLTVGQQVTGSSASSASANGSSASSGAGSASGTGASSAQTPTGASSSSNASSASSSANSSSTQVLVISTGAYIVNCTVDSTQVGQVKTGDQATITVSGSSSNVYGTVASVGLLATTSSGVSSFPVVIDVTGSPPGLYGGSSSTVSIITQQLQNVIVVPTNAITYSGNTQTVTLDSSGNKVTKAVGIGAASGGETQVTSGLSVGDKIYVTQVTFRGGARPGAGGSGAGLFGGTGSGGFRGGAGGGFPGGGAPSSGGFGG
jgi:membrane fusion protein, macrolide-specific efflux system